ncbi:MAG: type III pantothenate kinase [Nitrospiria bacterium]
MLLVIDIGNTDIVMGLFQDEKLAGQWRIATRLHQTPDEYGLLLRQLLLEEAWSVAQIDGVILSSVVPPLTSLFQEMISRYFPVEPLVVTEKLKTGLRLCIDNPKEIGADRIVNAAAAYHLYGGPLVIVDLGTATTFCVVSESGDYLGGAIAPGMALSAEALVSRAAKLPRIELSNPGKVIGTDTVSSMQSGLFFGYVGLIHEIVHRMHAVLGGTTPVIATGGLSSLIAPECPVISKIHPTLTLEGLMIIYKMNTSG